MLPHSFQVIASWAGASNDSNSEAVCFNNGNFKSLQVQNLLGVFFFFLLHDLEKTLEVGSLFSIPL